VKRQAEYSPAELAWLQMSIKRTAWCLYGKGGVWISNHRMTQAALRASRSWGDDL
jgi:hypothetical protein